MKCMVAFLGRDARFPDDIRDFLASQGIEAFPNPRQGRLDEDGVIELLADADGTLASNEPYTDKVFEALPKLKVVSRVGVGFDAVDVTAATKRGVVITTAPVPELAEAMAEHTFALILSLAKNVPQMNAEVHAGQYRPSHWGARMVDLYGLTLGLFGVGRIGSEVANRAKAFRMRLIYSDVVRRKDLEASLGLEFVSFEKLVEEADILSLHTPLNAQTKGVINEKVFARMKPTSLLINTARGAVVDEASLVRALEEKKIAGACVDAFSTEPLGSPNPLYNLGERLPNLIMTPHMGYGPRTGGAMAHQAARQLVDVLKGKRPDNILNPEVLGKTRANIR